jgi:hypothetical protein
MSSSEFCFNENFPTSREVWENVENFISNVETEVTIWPVITVNSVPWMYVGHCPVTEVDNTWHTAISRNWLFSYRQLIDYRYTPHQTDILLCKISRGKFKNHTLKL